MQQIVREGQGEAAVPRERHVDLSGVDHPQLKRQDRSDPLSGLAGLADSFLGIYIIRSTGSPLNNWGRKTGVKKSFNFLTVPETM